MGKGSFFAGFGVALLGAVVGFGAYAYFKNAPTEPNESEPPAVETVTSNFYDTVLSYNFEESATGDYVISHGLHLNGATGRIVEPSALNGAKSLQMTTSEVGATAQWNTMLESEFSPVVGQRYLVQMKLKHTKPESISTGTIALRLVSPEGEEVNGIFIAVGGTETHHLVVSATSDDATSYIYDATTGIFTINAYMTATSATQEVHLATVGGGVWSIVIDDYSISTVTTTTKTLETEAQQ